MKKVKIYTKDHCPYCVSAKKLLEQRNIPYEEIWMDPNNTTAREELIQKSGMKTLPVIYWGDELIGGYSQLKEKDEIDHLVFMH